LTVTSQQIVVSFLLWQTHSHSKNYKGKKEITALSKVITAQIDGN